MQDGKLPYPGIEGLFHRAYKARLFAYCDLVEWVTRGCGPTADCRADLCIPLANIRWPDAGA